MLNLVIRQFVISGVSCCLDHGKWRFCFEAGFCKNENTESTNPTNTDLDSREKDQNQKAISGAVRKTPETSGAPKKRGNLLILSLII
jgi:hypothetical protein